MFDSDLSALFGEKTIEDLTKGVELLSQLQSELNEPQLRQNLGFIDNEK
jgi:hypothetical protein